MDLGATVLNAFVVLAVGAILTHVTNDRFKSLRREIDGFRSDVKSDIAEVKSEIARLEDRMDAGLAAVHSQIVQVALAVGVDKKSAQG